MDGDQPREGVIRKAEPLSEEVELSSPTSVLHSMVQLPLAQHVDVALTKEGVCKKRRGKVGNFLSFSGGFKPTLLVCKQVPQPLCAGAASPLWVDTTSSG